MKAPRVATVAEEIERYLRTGSTDPSSAAWNGPGGIIDKECRARDALGAALVREVRRLAGDRSHPPLPITDPAALARRKVEPMVRGLFPRAEQAAILAVLERSVVFLTSESIERILLESSWLSSAWALANLYLGSIGAELLGKDAPQIVGSSEHMTCYVSVAYFEEQSPFADFIVHEAAHIFHNCKRRTVGLAETRRREWLLDLEFRKRETFAYSCEVYSRILERARSVAERRALAAEYAVAPFDLGDRVEADEHADIVREAAAARNGWKVILRRCARAKRPTAGSGLTAEAE